MTTSAGWAILQCSARGDLERMKWGESDGVGAGRAISAAGTGGSILATGTPSANVKMFPSFSCRYG